MQSYRKKKEQLVWLLIYTKAQQEIKANENLKRQGFNTFLPLIAASNQNEEYVPVFARYIFVQVNLELENWTSIKSSYGVSHVVMFGDNFNFVPDKIIELIKMKLDKNSIYKEEISSVDFKKGDSLTIKKGRFAGIDAIFLSSKSNERVRLLLKMLNTSVKAELDRSDIGKKYLIKSFKF